jgi:hypothetical protein
MHLLPLQDTSLVSVYYDASNEWLFADWHGDLTLPQVQAGCLTVAECFLQRPCTRILNNNGDVRSLSPDVPQWLAREYLPHLGLAGVEYLAWVRPPNLFSQRLVDETVNQVDVLRLALFDNLSDAYAWLHDSHFHHLDDPSVLSPDEQRLKLSKRVAALSAELAQNRNKALPAEPGWPPGCVVAPTRPLHP